MPPLAVPSSLVSTRPVTPTACVKLLRLRERVLALAGIEHQQHFVRRRRVEPAEHALHLLAAPPSGCSACAGGPAVSAISTSMPRACAACSASKITAAGSAPAACAITGTSLRSPQICSCSIAAARKVSPAASMTLRPSSLKRRASLPMVVVLPEPLTPTTSITNGCCAASIDERLRDRPQDLEHRASAARRAAHRGRRVPCARTRPRRPPRIFSVVSMPTSAAIRRVSSSSSTCVVDLAAGQQVREVVGEPGVAAVELRAQARERTLPGASVTCRAIGHALVGVGRSPRRSSSTGSRTDPW